MTNSKIKFTFTEDLTIGATIGLTVGFDFSTPPTFPTFPNDYLISWVNLRSTSLQVTTGTPTSLIGERAAINLAQALSLDFNTVSGYIVTRVANTVTLEYVTNLLYGTYTKAVFYSPTGVSDYLNNVYVPYPNHSSIQVEITEGSWTSYSFTDIEFGQASNPCSDIRLTVTTNELSTTVISPISISNNTYNPFFYDITRGQTINLTVRNSLNTEITQQVILPSILNSSNFTITTLYTPNGATITVNNTNSNGLNLEYSLDGAIWQSSNIFYNLIDDNYNLYVRDNYGCSFQKSFVVNSNLAFIPYFFISKSNSLRFAKRVDFATTYKNDENTLSCEVDCRLPKKEIQRYQSNDIVQNQFKSNYDLNVVKVIKEDLTEIDIPVIKKTSNIGIKSKMDAIIKPGGLSKTHVYFTTGNVYDYVTNAVTETYALNGAVPEWAVAGNFININGTFHLIEDIIFNETLNSDVIVFNGIYVGASTPIVVSCIYNAENYEVYEFLIDMSAYLDQYIRVKIISSHTGFPDLEHLSELICVKLIQENAVEIKYRNSTNTDVFYSTGIEFKIRQRIIFQNGISPQASENYKTDTNVILLSSDIYEGDEFVFEPITKELMRKVIAALSHDECFINDVGYTKNESIDFEGPLGDTNWYHLKPKMLKNGNVYN